MCVYVYIVCVCVCVKISVLHPSELAPRQYQCRHIGLLLIVWILYSASCNLPQRHQANRMRLLNILCHPPLQHVHALLLPLSCFHSPFITGDLSFLQSITCRPTSDSFPYLLLSLARFLTFSSLFLSVRHSFLLPQLTSIFHSLPFGHPSAPS